MSKIETAVQGAENIANNNAFGYSQERRWGNGDYDCSGLVLDMLEKAGIPVRTNGASYTGNMRAVLLSCGFKNVTGLINLATGAGLKRGDVLLEDTTPGHKKDHVAFYCGNGKIVHARSDDGHPETGDQTGREICIQNYYRFAACALRYDESAEQTQTGTGVVGNLFDKIFGKKTDDEPTTATVTPKPEIKYGKTGLEIDGICGPNTWLALANRMPYPGPWLGVAEKMPMIRKGSKGPAVIVLQVMLNQLGANLEPDGDFGKNTEDRLLEFQEGSV